MKVIAITGGIATGKSTGAQLLLEDLGRDRCAHFDCDAEAHNLLTKPDFVTKVREKFGDEVIDPDGSVNRSALRNLVFGNDARRLELEDLLHPEILISANKQIALNRESQDGPDWFVIEVPLLYEVDFPVERDLDVTVASSRNIQIERLKEKRQLDIQIIEKLLKAQHPVETKIEKANVVIWNDGELKVLVSQIELLGRDLRHCKIQPDDDNC